MRKTILILFIFIGSSLSFAQDNNISIKEYNYEYYHYYGTEKTYVWNLVITNNSAENYLTWINKNDNVMDYAEETQIKNFFRAGRPRLFFLWSDGEYSEKILGQTFLKLFIIAKTKCAFFQNEMCIFCIFFAVSQLVLNGLLNGF